MALGGVPAGGGISEYYSLLLPAPLYPKISMFGEKGGFVSVEEKAALLITEIEAALRRGTLHFRESDGMPLTTVKEILEAILDEGKVIFRPVSARG